MDILTARASISTQARAERMLTIREDHDVVRLRCCPVRGARGQRRRRHGFTGTVFEIPSSIVLSLGEKPKGCKSIGEVCRILVATRLRSLGVRSRGIHRSPYMYMYWPDVTPF